MRKIVLKVTNIEKSYDDFNVLKGISFGLYKGEKVGLVGTNGSGKSTLLKILGDFLKADKGSLDFVKKINIGYFPQEFLEDISVMDYLIQENNSEKYKSNIEDYFYKFNLDKKYLEKSIKNLSGGEKSKVALIKIINSKAGLFLLDEPTNNLDIATLIFFENFIRKSNKTFLIISHDRKFIDRIVGKIIEIDEFSKKSEIYNGNYSDYIKAKKNILENKWGVYNESVKAEKKLKHAVNKKMRDVSLIEVRGRQKKNISSKATDKDHLTKDVFNTQAGKLAKEAKLLKKKASLVKESGVKPEEKLSLRLYFDVDERSGDKVFEIKNVVKNIEDVNIGPINLSIKYGDKILILGANGIGKSTFLKIILGQTEYDGGCIEKGSRVSIGYLPQENYFNNENTVLKQFSKDTDIDISLGRALLYRFGIDGEYINKKIKYISPGVRSRLILAIIMSKKVNCLVLDEPSNHLDLEALEKLEEAVRDFKGTLILVSHDRYFINKIDFNKIFLFKKGEDLKSLAGYHEYEESI